MKKLLYSKYEAQKILLKAARNSEELSQGSLAGSSRGFSRRITCSSIARLGNFRHPLRPATYRPGAGNSKADPRSLSDS
jgi:hypothetical protein